MFLIVIQKETKTHGINFSFFSRYKELRIFSLKHTPLYIKNKALLQCKMARYKQNKKARGLQMCVNTRLELKLRAISVWCPSLTPGVEAREVPSTTFVPFAGKFKYQTTS